MTSPWITAIALTGALAAAGSAAGALTTSAIKSGIQGITPWDDPSKFFSSAAKAYGAAGLGGAIGPALGGASSALGIGSNAGTSAVEAGAMTPTALGVTPEAASQVVGDAGLHATEGGIGTALANVGRQTTSGAIQGALGDTRDPLRGAVQGAVGGAVGGGLNYVGQSTGMIPTRAPNFQPGGDMNASQMSMVQPSPTYQPSGVAPGLGTQLGQGAYGLGSRLAVGGAQQAVGAAMAPPPPPISPSAGLPGGYRPYWARSPYA